MASDILRAPQEFYDAYVFDMDGTIYLGDHLLPGAARLIKELRRPELPIRYLSNNPTLSTIFGRDLMSGKALAERLSHITEVVMGYVLRD